MNLNTFKIRYRDPQKTIVRATKRMKPVLSFCAPLTAKAVDNVEASGEAAGRAVSWQKTHGWSNGGRTGICTGHKKESWRSEAKPKQDGRYENHQNDKLVQTSSHCGYFQIPISKKM
jgi:hypothetical protein